jgi:cytochrome c oxidase cbb3-type subunit III
VPETTSLRAMGYENSAYQATQGKKLFAWFNCTGCHTNGGGGSGPALMDDEWLYGSRIENIVASIAEGRPNGMPSFRGKIPDEQIWQLAAYVRSLAGLGSRRCAQLQ